MAKSKISILDRIMSPTPRFFKTIRNIGVGLAAIGGAILASPVLLPVSIISIGGYLTVAGGIMSAVAQTTIEGE